MERNLEQWINYLKNGNIPALNEEESKQCEGQLTINECFQALESFPCNKSPGNDRQRPNFINAFGNC